MIPAEVTLCVLCSLLANMTSCDGFWLPVTVVTLEVVTTGCGLVLCPDTAVGRGPSLPDLNFSATSGLVQTVAGRFCPGLQPTQLY